MGWESRQDWPALEATLRAAAEAIATPEAFQAWARGELRAAFPHGWLLVILGNYSSLGATPTNCLSVDFPLDYVERVKTINGNIESPIIRRWFASLRPQHYEVGVTDWPEARPAWIQNATRYGIRNVIAHGHLYPREQRFAYVNLVHIPGGVSGAHMDFLERFAPVICEAAMRALSALPESNACAGAASDALSDRERQILLLASQGRTDKAIAKELDIAFGTVRTHLKRAGKKLGTSKRAEMVVLAASTKPGPSTAFEVGTDLGVDPGAAPAATEAGG